MEAALQYGSHLEVYGIYGSQGKSSQGHIRIEKLNQKKYTGKRKQTASCAKQKVPSGFSVSQK
jgi:hypothetical protein